MFISATQERDTFTDKWKAYRFIHPLSLNSIIGVLGQKCWKMCLHATSREEVSTHRDYGQDEMSISTYYVCDVNRTEISLNVLVLWYFNFGREKGQSVVTTC